MTTGRVQEDASNFDALAVIVIPHGKNIYECTLFGVMFVTICLTVIIVPGEL